MPTSNSTDNTGIAMPTSSSKSTISEEAEAAWARFRSKNQRYICSLSEAKRIWCIRRSPTRWRQGPRALQPGSGEEEAIEVGIEVGIEDPASIEVEIEVYCQQGSMP